MKLNYKRTFLVGLAFLSISAFWQMYDGVIPKILTNTFHLGESVSGILMAADNLLGLLLLPLFGSLSDRCNARLGRRMPFILAGTAGAAILMNLLPLLDNRFAAAPGPGVFWAFLGVLLCLLVCMATYRSPAVALMPDLTPKPLRSKANAVINLMGAAGGIFYLIFSSILYSGARTQGLTHVDYRLLFAGVSILMVVCVAILLLTVKERRLALEPEPEPTTPTGRQTLARPVKKSLGFLLLSVALWYIAYNAVTTWFTTYAGNMWGMSLGQANQCLTVAMAGAIASYLPAGFLASKIGRKKSILAGVAVLAASFLAGFLCTRAFSGFHPGMFVIFVLVGIAWAVINVNSLPMVVEMCREADVGKFTGYYYAFSMAAQIITPVAAGWFLEHVSYHTLFPYAALAAGCAFFTMLFVRHGDSMASAPRGLEAFSEIE